MTGVITVSEFDQDVTEYKMMHKSTVENFMNGVIKLGEILNRQKDKWKPEGKWIEYLKATGISERHSRLQIQLFEYSLKDMKTLMEVNIQNFSQLMEFLKLGEEEQKELAKEIAGEALPTTDFMSKVDNVIEQDPETEQELQMVPNNDLDFSSMLKSSTMVDIPFMAKQILDAMNKQEGMTFSKKCIPIVETFLHTQQSINLLQENINKLSEEEAEYWNKQLLVQVNKLNSIINLTK